MAVMGVFSPPSATYYGIGVKRAESNSSVIYVKPNSHA
jgi:hypothetical protein